MAEDIIALKPYLKAVRAFIQPLSQKELVELVVRMAGDSPPENRIGFLQLLESNLTPASQERSFRNEEEALLREIHDLVKSARKRMDSILDGTFWEDEDHWEELSHRGYGMDNDDNPDALSEEDEQALTTLAGRIGGCFLAGQFAFAARAYKRLLTLFDQDLVVEIKKVNVVELKARYLRALLETTPGDKRVRVMLAEMDRSADFLECGEALEGPSFLDVINAFPEPIADWDGFLQAWKQALGKRPGDRAKALSLEAVLLSEGIDGIRRHVRNGHDGHPMGFAFWAKAARANQDWAEMKVACMEGLESMGSAPLLPERKGWIDISFRYRAEFAAALEEAGSALKDDPTVLLARWECFATLPSDASLKGLLTFAETMNQGDEQLECAAKMLLPLSNLRSMALKVDLLRGDWGPVVEQLRHLHSSPLEGADPDVANGLCLAATLAALCREKAGTACVVCSLLDHYADCESRTFLWDDEVSEPTVGTSPGFFSLRIINSILRAPLPPDQWGELYQLVEEQVHLRAGTFLENRQRGEYKLAAQLLAALAQTLDIQGDRAGALSLLHDYAKVRFNRLSSFRRELDPFLKLAKLA